MLEQSPNLSIEIGPKKAFSAIQFRSSLNSPQTGGGLHVRTKDQDFAIARRIYLKTSYKPTFDEGEVSDFYIAYIAAECKTNLDKTMFQEASATAHDVKSVVAGSKYFLLCEWLDMTPQSTSATDIDEVLVLRRAKRMGSNTRSNFGSVEGRAEHRQMYVDFLDEHPFASEVFERLVGHIVGLLTPVDPGEDDVLSQGFF